jgi:hypothetical protein
MSWSEDLKYKAGHKSLFYLMLPLGVYLSALCGYQMLSFWGVLLFIPLGVGLIYVTASWQASCLS